MCTALLFVLLLFRNISECCLSLYCKLESRQCRLLDQLLLLLIYLLPLETEVRKSRHFYFLLHFRVTTRR